MTQKIRDPNLPSLLLTPDENELVFNMVGPRCSSLATAVVQLFITEGPAHNEWIQIDTGVLCFIKNNPKRAYFFGIYCLERQVLIWEHEVYKQIQYKVSKPSFHTFEAQEYMVAFNFASEAEASTFDTTFQAKTNKEKRKLVRLENTIKQSEISPQINQQKSGNHVQLRSNNGTRAPVQAAPGINYGTPKLKKGKKLTKAEIGDPCNFQHVYGPSLIAGWNNNNGLDIEGLMAKIDVGFLAQAGVSESHLKDERTRSFIASFIHDHGGPDAVQKEINQNDNQPNSTKENVPVWSTVLNYATGGRKKPKQRKNTNVGIIPGPVVPVNFDDFESKRKNEDSFAKPTTLPPIPPAPPTRVAPPRPQPPRQPSQSGGGPPPPPPPPPPPGPMFSPPAHQPPNTSVAPANTDNRADLFQSIRSGQTLKRVQTTPENSEKPQEEKGDLLGEIRKGIKLKKPVDAVKKEPKKFADGSLANALALALEERSKSMYSDNSSTEQEASSEDDDWET